MLILIEKDVENWMLKTTLPKFADCEKDLNRFADLQNFYFITKRTSFFVCFYLCVRVLL